MFFERAWVVDGLEIVILRNSFEDGNLKLEDIPNKKGQEIKTSGLMAGLHICRFTDVSGKISSKKFIQLE